MRRFAFYFLLLLLCGDVVLNPGMDTATLQKILEGQEVIKAKLDSIKTNQAAQKAALEQLSDRIFSLETRVTSLANLEPAVAECKVACEEQKHSVQTLLAKVDDLENRSRRCNLIFYGVPEGIPAGHPSGEPERKGPEPWSVSEQHIVDICSGKLGITPETIQRAHRIGKFRPGKIRALIANFASFKEKQDILLSAKKLKGTNISLSEDFSQEVRNKRRPLLNFAKSRKNDDTKVNLRYDTLYLDKVKYIYDDTLNQVVQSK